jgi:hypothetical protein
MNNRYKELSIMHKKSIDELINSIASHQSEPYMDKQICNAVYDSIKHIYIGYIKRGEHDYHSDL